MFYKKHMENRTILVVLGTFNSLGKAYFCGKF